ncbi:ABC transporter permease subunit [Sandaracinobacter sp. RS1-74]|uniref:ABC transporter permease subunit n=1 Tax=Sandaracinobacteroides sayramensis TaxID=2913411 RepID=UPI001ED9D466|nr:ABC transporter permease subunit [Sandaracinobacteroides sayramensis]MCG2842058.1 ABC transporter permease subunit [Sandaracinobacteroides sayramensis]
MSWGTSIARLELVRAWRDPVMRAMLILFLIAAGYAALTGARWAEQRQLAVQEAVAKADEIMGKRRDEFAAMVAKGEKPNFGLIYASALPFRAGLPNAPLAALSAGQAEGYPAAANVAPFADPWAMFDSHATGLESPAVLAAGRFDLAFVIVVLMPLLLLAATYDFWARDVENGSARFQLAQPVRPAKLILTRALVRGGSILLGAMLIACGWLLAAGGQHMRDIAVLAMVILAYGAFWIALAILINLLVRVSTTAALAGGTAWLAIVLLLPAVAVAVAELAAPPPSAMAYTNAVRVAGLEVREANRSAARQAATAESGRAYPASLWHSRGEALQRDARLGPIHRAYAEGWARHRALEDRLRFLSPAVIAQDALDRVAGTDAGRATAFQRQARDFAAEARKLAFDWMDKDRLMTLADYDRPLLRFEFVEPPRSGPLLRDILALLLFTALVLAPAALRLRQGAAKLL